MASAGCGSHLEATLRIGAVNAMTQVRLPRPPHQTKQVRPSFDVGQRLFGGLGVV